MDFTKIGQRKARAMPKEILRQELLDVSEGMRRYGGSFCEELGILLRIADTENARKIKVAWPLYWSRYLEVGRTTREERQIST